MKEKVDKLKENSILGLEVMANLGVTPGISGTIITKDKKVYSYSLHSIMTSFMEKNNIPLENIYLIKELTSDEYNKILKYIEEIVYKKYKCIPHRDSSSSVFGSSKSKMFYYPNCYDVNTNESLYDKTLKLIEEVKK